MDAKNANVSTNLFNVFIAFQAWNPNIVQGVRFGGQLMPQNWLLIDLHFYLDFVLFHWPCSLEAFASFFSRFPSNLPYLLAKISNWNLLYTSMSDLTWLLVSWSWTGLEVAPLEMLEDEVLGACWGWFFLELEDDVDGWGPGSPLVLLQWQQGDW